MKVLVTGGAGFSGSILVPLILDAGHRVTVLDNFLYGQSPFLDRCGDENLEIIRDDVRHIVTLKRALWEQEAIIPLAALVGAPACDRDKVGARTINLDAIRDLMRFRDPSQYVVYPNSNSGYGICPDGQSAREDSPLSPLSLYAKLKVAAEDEVLRGDHTVSLRFATLYGASPRMRRDLLVNDFTWRAVTDGWLLLYEPLARRPILHVRDAARAILWALEKLTEKRLTHRVYNVAAETVTKRELCHAIHWQRPAFHWVEGQGHDPDRRDYAVDCARIFAEGWKPERTLEEGIGELLKCYQILAGQEAHTNA